MMVCDDEVLAFPTGAGTHQFFSAQGRLRGAGGGQRSRRDAATRKWSIGPSGAIVRSDGSVDSLSIYKE